MRDIDLYNIIHRSSNIVTNTSISNDIFNMNIDWSSDWNQPQILNFNGTTNTHFSTDKINARKTYLAEKALDFFMSAAYADELPLLNIGDPSRKASSNMTKPEETFSVFLKAVDGYSGAK